MNRITLGIEIHLLCHRNINFLFHSSCSTTRQIRDLYNNRSGEDPIIQNSDLDREFQAILLKAIQAFPMDDDDEEDFDEDDKPISYTVKLKDSDDISPSKVRSQRAK